jgi:uncharacterized protein
MTLRKSYNLAEFKARGDAGEFEALVSVFGNVDIQGDRVVKGAFTKSLDNWRASGDPIPVIWSHDWGNPFAHIGTVDPKNAVETDAGLRVKGQIDLNNDFGAQVFSLLKDRRVTEFSFAYDVVTERTASDRANELTELNLLEVGPTLKGANPETELVGVKAALEEAAAKNVEPESIGTVFIDVVPNVIGAKVGRAISAKNEARIKAVAQAIRDHAETHAAELEDVLSAVQAAAEEPKADEEPAEDKTEEPVTAKVEESPWERHIRIAAEIADLGVR